MVQRGETVVLSVTADGVILWDSLTRFTWAALPSKVCELETLGLFVLALLCVCRSHRSAASSEGSVSVLVCSSYCTVNTTEDFFHIHTWTNCSWRYIWTGPGNVQRISQRALGQDSELLVVRSFWVRSNFRGVLGIRSFTMKRFWRYWGITLKHNNIQH